MIFVSLQAKETLLLSSVQKEKNHHSSELVHILFIVSIDIIQYAQVDLPKKGKHSLQQKGSKHV